MYKDTKHVLIPLEIVVDVVLYNGPFLIVLQRLLYLAWKVAYDEAVLTGAICEDESGVIDTPTLTIGSFLWTRRSEDDDHHQQRTRRPGTHGYVGLSLTDLDEAELGQSRVVGRGGSGRSFSQQQSSTGVSSSSSSSSKGKKHVGSGAVPTYEARDSSQQQQKTLSPKAAASSPRGPSPRSSPRSSPRTSPSTSPKTGSPLRNVLFSMESTDDEDSDNEDNSNVKSNNERQ
jgi:hypothetical protein